MRSLKALLLGAILLAALAPLAPARAGVPGAPLCFQVLDDPTNDPFQNEQFFAVNVTLNAIRAIRAPFGNISRSRALSLIQQALNNVIQARNLVNQAGL